ncbi:MAG: N-6 DNA methylase, partial [Akkermansiaceae bacterium]|nr:N-6 DNA methylase [Akkermansiaceae bacterium]
PPRPPPTTTHTPGGSDDPQRSEPDPWPFFVGEWREAILARVVKKCGDRRYWDDWAKNIAGIADRQKTSIDGLLARGHGAREFDSFLAGLRENINPDISRGEAVEMLAQQAITRPVFDALFDSYPFAEKNPVSRSMNAMLSLIQEQLPGEDARELTRFYESVKERAAGIDNAEGRQKVIVELYDKFFKNAFPRMADKLGIVYTPIEIVDFIIRSVHAALRKEFGLPQGLAASGVRILDPFTGTGTFIVRLIQSGLIKKKDLPRKYSEELFACEIVLLAYYIACVNIEEAYHGAMKTRAYQSFEGLCMTDTFQMSEKGGFLSEMFSENAERVRRLSHQDIRVIIGNPPYSAGQKSANDNNRNQSYPSLDARIENTYVRGADATNKNSLYDSYIRAFRWASDRITEDGIVAFVTNGSFIDNNAMNGFRRTLLQEFSSVYCFNLRGNARTSGIQRQKEKGNVFGSGSRTPAAITLLVKKKGHSGPGRLFYHDIGDYLSREEKLARIREFEDIDGIPWQELTPDEHGDWINHRDPGFSDFMPIGDKETKGLAGSRAVFSIFSRGLATGRDAWCYNFSRSALERNMKKTIDFYNAQLNQPEVTYDPASISWTRAALANVKNKKQTCFSAARIRPALYRPFCKANLYFDRMWNEMVYQQPKLFPTEQHENLVIQLTGNGSTKPFSCLISNMIPDLEVISKGQCFPLYWYEKKDKTENALGLDLDERKGDYIRRDAVTDFALGQFRQAYGDFTITREDIFYYVYGVLHSPEYRERFASNLKKELPRIPYAKDFRAFSGAGRELAQRHLNYETAEPWPVTEESHGDEAVEKMKFPKKEVKDIIVYNKSTVLKGIPPEAHDYIVNGKSAIEWVMERYQVKTDKESGLLNDPNDWCREHHEPRYILGLLRRVIRVSVETVRIVQSLPGLEEIN